MAPFRCPCCGVTRAQAAVLRRRPLRWRGAWEPDPAFRVRRHALCDACERWLFGVLSEVRGQPARQRTALLGVPSTGGRLLVFDDQCQLCFAVPEGRGTMADCVSLVPNGESWPPFFLCAACDAWLASLATDGRSLRGRASRSIDGAYGDWPHPNLRDLRVSIDLTDRDAAEVIRATCAAMGVEIVRGFGALGSVLFLQVRSGSAAAAAVRENLAVAAAVILVVPLAGATELRDSLGAGAASWLTLPPTPQQVTATLAATLRGAPRLQWDAASCLPVASLEGHPRPAIVFEPAEHTDRFTLAWLLKRFARGYDDVVSVGGKVVLVPRVPPERLEEVRVRLEALLEGRSTAAALPALAPFARRIDLAG